MSLNLFFYLLPAVAIACISLPNHIIDTSKCTRHWLAILLIFSSVTGLLGYKEFAITLMLVTFFGVCLFFLHKTIKQLKHIEIK